jgi:hypothetical protein
VAVAVAPFFCEPTGCDFLARKFSLAKFFLCTMKFFGMEDSTLPVEIPHNNGHGEFRQDSLAHVNMILMDTSFHYFTLLLHRHFVPSPHQDGYATPRRYLSIYSNPLIDR